MCAVHIDMRNSIEREQQSYVVSRPMGHASHECNVYAKDKRLGHAIFGLWKRRRIPHPALLVRSTKKVGLEKPVSNLPCVTCSHPLIPAPSLQLLHFYSEVRTS